MPSLFKNNLKLKKKKNQKEKKLYYQHPGPVNRCYMKDIAQLQRQTVLQTKVLKQKICIYKNTRKFGRGDLCI